MNRQRSQQRRNWRSRFSRMALPLWGGILYIILGCQQSDTTAIRLQLNWFPDAQHGGFIAADVHGYFQQEGLQVEILPGGPGTPVIPKLSMGQVEFAVANADQVLLARAQGAETVALLAALQTSPRCIMVHAASGIRTFGDLRNLVLAMGEGKAFAEFLKQQVSLEGVRIVPYAGTVAKFLSDANYAQQAYVFSEPLVAQRAGGDPHCLMVADLGFNPYTSVLVADSKLMDERPELVRRFVRAVWKGWQTYLEDPAPSNRELQRLNQEMELEQLSMSAKQIRQLALPHDGQPSSLGQMTAERWHQLERQLIQLELLTAASSAATAAYTTKFLPAEH